MDPVVVIGGGLAGLAAAARLAKDGHQVELFERSYSLGGCGRRPSSGPGSWSIERRRSSASRPRGETCSARAGGRWRRSWPDGLCTRTRRAAGLSSPTAPSSRSRPTAAGVRDPDHRLRPAVAERWRSCSTPSATSGRRCGRWVSRPSSHRGPLAVGPAHPGRPPPAPEPPEPRRPRRLGAPPASRRADPQRRLPARLDPGTAPGLRSGRAVDGSHVRPLADRPGARPHVRTPAAPRSSSRP